MFKCSAAETGKPSGPSELTDTALPQLPAWLLALSGTIKFEAKEIQTPNSRLRDVEIPVKTTPDRILIEQANLTTTQGELLIDFAVDKHSRRFTATIQAEHLVFTDDESPSTNGLIFDNEILLPEWLSTLDGELNIAISTSEIAKIKLKDLGGEFFFRGRKLTAQLSAGLENGHLRANFEHDYDNSETKMSATGSAVPLHLMPATRDYLVDTALNFESDLYARGNTPREFAETLNGTVTVEAMHGNIDIRKLEKLSQDILSLTLTSIIPIPFGSHTAQLECAVIKFPIKNGVANSANAIALRTQNLAVMGGGEINFADESLDIRLHPHARSTTKINTKTAVKEVKLAGPLRDIQVDAKLGGILTQGISLTTKIAALGLSKLKLPLLDWAAPGTEACMSTLTNEHP